MYPTESAVTRTDESVKMVHGACRRDRFVGSCDPVDEFCPFGNDTLLNSHYTHEEQREQF